MRSKCAGSCACVSSPGRGRCRSYSRDSQKRSAAARSSDGHASRSSARQRTRRVVRRYHRRRERGVESAVGVASAPVVDGDREVVREEIGRREAEVDDARHAIAGEQHVVAEEIAVDRALGQLAAAEAGLELDLGVEQRRLRGVETRLDRACGLAPPRGSAAIGQARAIGLRRDVQPRRARRPRGRSASATASPPARRRRARRGPRACR